MRCAYSFHHRHEIDHERRLRLLGGKGANLAVMSAELHLPVPPGFTITTETCVRYLHDGWPQELSGEVEEQLRSLEERAGRRFGDPDDPLLLSVRSGAAVSMPGMMDTILNLGITDETCVGLARSTNDERFALDCRQRFVHTYQAVVGTGTVPEAPRAQLRGAIEAVFQSWNSERARVFREIEGIDHDLGTAVTVQAMVFGNRNPSSATGVMFTRNPATGEAAAFGDILFEAQGQDVVDGSRLTQHLDALEQRLPEAAKELAAAAGVLEHHLRDLCDIEFTVEDGRLWLLQVRVGKRSPRAALRIAVEMAEDPDFPLDRREAVFRVARHLEDPPRAAAIRSAHAASLGTGLGASPGVGVGRIALTPDDAVRLAQEGDEVILVRPETSPADVHGMAVAAGILTSRGGVASHAAVVAREWGVPAVVGASEIEIHSQGVTIGGVSLDVGDVVTIDGDTGEVFAGEIQVLADPVPEAAILSAWATELGVPVDAPSSDDVARDSEESTEAGTTRAGALAIDDLIQLAAIKNFILPEQFAAALDVEVAALDHAVTMLRHRGFVEPAGSMHRLSEAGHTEAKRFLAADRSRWGSAPANAALDAFLPLDQSLKVIVTAWQLRDVDGGQEINDHTDPDYDDGVLGELGDLHEDAAAWLDDAARGLPRLAQYRVRLDKAIGRALAGDVQFVTAPMLDSYHTIWFELHEDLIRLAGRTRADETEVGRA